MTKGYVGRGGAAEVTVVPGDKGFGQMSGDNGFGQVSGDRGFGQMSGDTGDRAFGQPSAVRPGRLATP